MNILILGATGMAGHVISLYLQEQGHNVTAFSREPFPYCENIQGNAMDVKFMESLLLSNKYDVVINCIGVLNTDCDKNPETAVYLNSYLPHLLVNLLKNTPTKLIHMSTDCVFSGKTGFYNEGSSPDGDTFYDRSKALGEINDNKNLTFRNSIIGPDMKVNGIGLFNWFMKQNGTIQGYQKAMWTGVTTLTLAKAMEKSITEDITGIYHLVNNETISKFELLKIFNNHFRSDDIIITPNNNINLNKSLINNRQDFCFEVPSYNQMIIEMKDWIINHQNIYPHYFYSRKL